MDKLTEACGDGGDARSANPMLKMVDMFMRDPAQHADSWAPSESHRAAALMRRQQAGPESSMRQFLSPEEFERFSDGGLNDAFRQMDISHDEYADAARFLRPPVHPAEAYQRGSRWMPPPVAPPPQHLLKDRDARLSMYEQGRSRQRPGAPLTADLTRDFVSEYESALHDHEDMSEFEEVYTKPRHYRPPGRDLWAQEFERHQQEFGDFEDIYSQQTREKRAEEWVEDFNDPETQEALQSDAEAAARLRDTASKFLSPALMSDPKMRNSAFMRMMEQLSNGDLKLEGNGIAPQSSSSSSSRWAEEFNSQQSQPSMVEEFEKFEDQEDQVNPPNIESMRNWLKQFETMDETELEQQYEKAWRESANEGEETSVFAERTQKLNRPYEFQPNNPFLSDPDAFVKGIKEFDTGTIRKAILLLEAAVQQDMQNSQAWQYLGQAQAENDRDDLASLALLRAVQANPLNRDALMALSVSYTNDFHKDRALDCLYQWIDSHPAYSAITNEMEGRLTDDEDANQQIVTDIFLKAARTRIQDPDPDVQTALGLLFNLSFEYDRAADCFKAAVSKRPNDYLLWNKLGATQANGRRSDEAIDAYFRALEIKPTYTRARANLGISFLALNHYGEAAKAFLSALNLNPDAEHIWGNLRTVFSLMQRMDLVDKCDARDVRLFADEFNFA